MAIAKWPENNDSGYDYCFVETLHDRYICKICHLPSRDPHLSVCCGHLFCKSCLDKIKRTAAITNDCPVCRNEEFVKFPNKAIDREIKALHIYCTNKEKGCEWQGELNTINNHLDNSDGCQFEEVECSNECGEIIERRYLTSHVETECPCRKVNCQYCHDTGEHQFIEGQHKEECPKLPLPCPNKCEVGSVPREDMEAHRKECPLEVIQCEYYSVGCKRIKLTRKDQDQHYKEKMEEHLIMTKNELTGTKAQLNKLTVYVRSLQLDALMRKLNVRCPVTFKISELSDKEVGELKWSSDSFYTHHKGYKMTLGVDDYGDEDGNYTHLSVYLHLMKGQYDDELTWPLRERFEVKLLNQLSDSENFSSTITYGDRTPDHCANRVMGGSKASGWGHRQFISNGELCKATSSCQYLKDDCLFLQVTKL